MCTEPLPFSYCHSCHHLKQLSSPELNLPETHSKIQTCAPCRYSIRAPFDSNQFNMYADSSATASQHFASCILAMRKWQILVQKSNYASSTVLLTGESLMNDCNEETSIKLFKNRDSQCQSAWKLQDTSVLTGCSRNLLLLTVIHSSHSTWPWSSSSKFLPLSVHQDIWNNCNQFTRCADNSGTRVRQWQFLLQRPNYASLTVLLTRKLQRRKK